MSATIRSPGRRAATTTERIVAWELAYRAIVEVLISRKVVDAERIAVDAAVRLVIGARD